MNTTTVDPEAMHALGSLKKLGLPFFCIGGITRENATPTLVRAAVCAGVIAAKDVAAAARSIRARLTSSASSSRGRRGTAAK